MTKIRENYREDFYFADTTEILGVTYYIQVILSFYDTVYSIKIYLE